VPKVKTCGKRLPSKLTKVNLWALRVRNRAQLPDIWKTFQANLARHIRYHGVSINASTGACCMNAFILSLVFELGTLRSNEGGGDRLLYPLTL
jgi:hypothetical protein